MNGDTRSAWGTRHWRIPLMAGPPDSGVSRTSPTLRRMTSRVAVACTVRPPACKQASCARCPARSTSAAVPCRNQGPRAPDQCAQRRIRFADDQQRASGLPRIVGSGEFVICEQPLRSRFRRLRRVPPARSDLSPRAGGCRDAQGGGDHRHIGRSVPDSAFRRRGSCRATTFRVAALRAQRRGSWWSAPAGSESGWGLTLAHQDDVIFATCSPTMRTATAMWLHDAQPCVRAPIA